jgi:CubicO group peptidase (beta-lactamase class C family)
MYVGKKENGCPVPDRKVSNDITVLHLMTHTSGIMSGDFAEPLYPEVDRYRTTLEKAVDYYPTTLLAFEPFSKHAYSALAAFDVAARIIELISGLPYDEYLEQNIFAPLGMKDTSFSVKPERRARFTPVHSRNTEGHAYTVDFSGTLGNLPDTYFCAGAGLAGTADDYAKFADMLRAGGKGVLKPESVALMRTVHWPGWGIGVRVMKGDKYLPDGCYGWSGAYGTHYWVDPSRNLYAIYMKNSMYDGGAGAKTARSFEKAVAEGLT